MVTFQVLHMQITSIMHKRSNSEKESSRMRFIFWSQTEMEFANHLLHLTGSAHLGISLASSLLV